MNQIYKRNEFIVVPACEDFIIRNTKKGFRDKHTHVKSLGYARLLIDLDIKKELPINPALVESLIRISQDEEYIKELQEFKEDSEYISIKELMHHDSYRRVHGAIKRVR